MLLETVVTEGVTVLVILLGILVSKGVAVLGTYTILDNIHDFKKHIHKSLQSDEAINIAMCKTHSMNVFIILFRQCFLFDLSCYTYVLKVVTYVCTYNIVSL